MNKVSDETIVQKVTRQLGNRGMQSPCRIAVAARKGDVTLTGTIQYEYQRIAAMHAVRSIDGVRRVMDHLKVQAKAAQKLIPTQRPTADIAPPPTEQIAPPSEKTSPTIENAAPTSEKTAPVIEIATPTCGNR